MEHKEKRKYGPSTVAKLRVARLGEMGAFLDAETGNTSDDILLHQTQQTAPVKVGEEVEVFLYLDPKRRLTASMRVPRMKEGQIARLRVINVSRDGAFLDVGAERGILCLMPACADALRSAKSSGQNFIPINPAGWP